MTPPDLRALATRVAGASREDADRDQLGVEVNQALGIASYITDDGDPVLTIDGAVALLPPDAYWRLGHDGEGADPSLFKVQVLYPDRIGMGALVTAVAALPGATICAALLRDVARQAEQP